MQATGGDFGPNEWLIEEMYRRYAEDPSSVGEAWREFFDMDEVTRQLADGNPAE